VPKVSINVIKKHLPLIQKYKREYPYLSGQKLAMVIKEKENMTIDQDYLRSIINGSAMVKEIEPVNFDEVDFNIELPETLSIERENFKIPAGIDRVLFISDAHIPFHSIEPIKIALKYAYENGVRGIFLGGDIFDFYASSNFLRLPGLRNLQKEIKSGRTFLYNLRDKFPDIEIYFKEGNHEFRYQRKLMESSPELFEVDSLQLDEVLHLPKLNIKYIDYYTITDSDGFSSGIDVSMDTDGDWVRVEDLQDIGWMLAVDTSLVTAHLGVVNVQDSYEVAKNKLQSLIQWHIDVALDPCVNGGYKLVKVGEE